MDHITLLSEIGKELRLGTPLYPPVRIMGGYLHKMYRIQTNKGDYAIKLLNPLIMERKDAMGNYKKAERLEIKLEAANIPIVATKLFNHKKMQYLNQHYYYVFDWIEGRTLEFTEVEKYHCQIIGSILAKIHKIETKQVINKIDELKVDWSFYIKQAQQTCLEIAPLLIKYQPLLETFQEIRNRAIKKIPPTLCITHGDMDRKNVLWDHHQPKIIDLECLDYRNPYLELLELSLCWSGFEQGQFNEELFNTFIKAYQEEWGPLQVDWENIYYSNDGRIGWLEYNIKRALMIECSDEEERILGIEQVKSTLKQIEYYLEIKGLLLRQLNRRKDIR